jgi:hypothetical protein
MKVYFELVKIEGKEENLPTETGFYWTYQGDIHHLTSDLFGIMTKDYWLKNVQWYLKEAEI